MTGPAPLVAAVGAAVLVAVLVSVAPRLGGIILAIVVFRMLTAGVQTGKVNV